MSDDQEVSLGRIWSLFFLGGVVLVLLFKLSTMTGVYWGCDYGEVSYHQGVLSPQCVLIDYTFAYCEDLVDDRDFYVPMQEAEEILQSKNILYEDLVKGMSTP